MSSGSLVCGGRLLYVSRWQALVKVDTLLFMFCYFLLFVWIGESGDDTKISLGQINRTDPLQRHSKVLSHNKKKKNCMYRKQDNGIIFRTDYTAFSICSLNLHNIHFAKAPMGAKGRKCALIHRMANATTKEAQFLYFKHVVQRHAKSACSSPTGGCIDSE